MASKIVYDVEVLSDIVTHDDTDKRFTPASKGAEENTIEGITVYFTESLKVVQLNKLRYLSLDQLLLLN